MKQQQEVLTRLRAIVSEVLQLDEVELDMTTTADQVEGWDSVSTIEIMVAVEEAFGIRLKTGEMASMSNVGTLVNRILAG
ncbi:MAG TPA: acyl carrier protein [Candidatus Polarisedimenticolia bacterium]|nr:acyl carrier protein [Candidatus Polarisedimenticolia bacterium]